MAAPDLGSPRVIYGNNAEFRSFSSQLAKAFGAKIPYPTKEPLWRKNLQRTLNPVLTACEELYEVAVKRGMTVQLP